MDRTQCFLLWRCQRCDEWHTQGPVPLDSRLEVPDAIRTIGLAEMEAGHARDLALVVLWYEDVADVYGHALMLFEDRGVVTGTVLRMTDADYIAWLLGDEAPGALEKVIEKLAVEGESRHYQAATWNHVVRDLITVVAPVPAHRVADQTIPMTLENFARLVGEN